MNDTSLPGLDRPVSPAALAKIDASVSKATDALLAAQHADGYWLYELEADATIPAEYVLLVHYLGETPNLELETEDRALSAPYPAR